MMSNLYCVKAYYKGQVIWQFNAIVAKSTQHAIYECRSTMTHIMGVLNRDYEWKAELEWENNLAVN